VWRYLTHGSHRVRITTAEGTHAHRVMQVLVVNSPYYAWALPLLPDATMEDGILDVAVFPRMGRFALLRSLIAVMRSRRLPERPVRYRGAKIQIESDAPLSIHADGVLAGTLPSEFRCRAGALRVFA
jgi:diacylglycerol kinase family enzyme